MGLQRIRFINKDGQPYDMVLDIIKKRSKVIETINPEDGSRLDIPRTAVLSITEPIKDETERCI
jgi:hypothetical protein